MNFVSNLTLVVAAVSFTLGAIHLKMCFGRRNRLANVLFVCSALSLVVYAMFERAMMKAAMPAQHGELLRWTHVVVWFLIISTAWFVHASLRTGRIWLLWSIGIVRALALILNFISPVNLNYLEVSSIRQVTFLGESLSVAVGVPNPWMIVGNASLVLFMIFCVDAMISLWRRGDRRRALTIGASVAVLSTSALVFAISVLWGFAQLPLMESPFFLGIIFSMGYELTRDVQRAAQLSEELLERDAELRESEEQLGLSANAGNVGIWTRNIRRNKIWASDKWLELFEFAKSDPLSVEIILAKVHELDRERLAKTLASVLDVGGDTYETEYRIVLANAEVRWIGSSGKVELKNGEPAVIRDASVDITKRKLAEGAAHDLSAKLIGAQETERSRVARELHDDFSQSLALLSIQLETLGRHPAAEREKIKPSLDALSEHVHKLSSDVHRISHELHPAKLEQLGLVSAVRGFCREITDTHALAVECEAHDVPRSLPNDIALCLYRITQESIQNIVKHSGASTAKVKLTTDDGEVRLTISDNGRGFDPQGSKVKESLGLVSMQERILSVNGTLSVESSIGTGTRIEVCVPVYPAP